jgi:hypothetical protein
MCCQGEFNAQYCAPHFDTIRRISRCHKLLGWGYILALLSLLIVIPQSVYGHWEFGQFGFFGALWCIGLTIIMVCDQYIEECRRSM